MPPKIRELIHKLRRAGFVEIEGKGSHRNFIHPKGPRLTLSGRSGDDALKYQEKEVAERIAEVES